MGDNHRMRISAKFVGVVAAVTLLATTGCANSSEISSNGSPAESSALVAETTSPIVITPDDLGPIPSLSSETSPDAPQRIVSLATGIGETLVALGVADRVVGRDEASAVADLASIPVVTQGHSTSAESVLSLEPDLVLVDAASGPPEAIDQIRSAGIRVVEVPEAWTLEDLEPRVQAVADAVGASGVSVPEMNAPASTTEGPRVAFLYLRGTSAIYLLGGEGSGADALIEAAGGMDVGAQQGLAAFTPLTAESLATADPEVLLVMTKGLESVGGIDGLLSLPGVQQTTAATNRAVVAVDDNVLLSFGPRTPQLIEKLREALDQLGTA